MFRGKRRVLTIKKKENTVRVYVLPYSNNCKKAYPIPVCANKTNRKWSFLLESVWRTLTQKIISSQEGNTGRAALDLVTGELRPGELRPGGLRPWEIKPTGLRPRRIEPTFEKKHPTTFFICKLWKQTRVFDGETRFPRCERKCAEKKRVFLFCSSFLFQKPKLF